MSGSQQATGPATAGVNGSMFLEDAQYEVRVAGRFRMGKKIGSGSFGEIFLAVDLHTGKEVAVKFVH